MTQRPLNPVILRAALAGLEAQRAKLEDQLVQVRTMLGTQPKQLGRPPENAARYAAAPICCKSVFKSK